MHTAIILEDDITIAWDYEILLKDLGVHVHSVVKSWPEALPVIRKTKPDLVIVDLVLSNDQKGFEFIEGIKNLFIPMIVCTGFSNQKNVDKALSLGVQAFITKPIDRLAFVFHVKKALSLSRPGDTSKQYMIIPERGSLIKVPFEKIVKVLVDGNYCFVILNDSKRFVLKQSLSTTLESLDSDRFIRCHRSSVVNLDYVVSIDSKNNKIVLTDGEVLDMSLSNILCLSENHSQLS